MTIYRSGLVKPTITFTSDVTDIQVPPNESLVVKLGDAAGATAFSITDSASVQQFAIDSDGNVTFNGDLFITDDDYLAMGNTAAAPDAILGWNTTQTVDALFLGLSATQNTFIIGEYADIAYDFAHAAQTNPTLYIQSAAQSATEFAKLNAGDLSFGLGIAVIATDYSIGRNADATNQLQFNVPTGAGYEWSVNDGSLMTFSSIGLLTVSGNGIATANGQASFTRTTNLASAYTAGITSTNTAVTGNTAYGLWNLFTSSAVVTGTNQSLYGSYNSITKIGADTSVNITSIFAVYGAASNTGSTDAGTKNTYGGYFSAAGDTAGTSTAYGIYATASGADTNIAGYFNGNIQTINDANLIFGTDNSDGTKSTIIQYDTVQTVDSTLIGLDATSRTLHICDWGDIGYDFALVAQSNPTFVIHSASQSATQWLSLAHDQTNGVIAVGTGSTSFPLLAAGKVYVNGTSTANTGIAGVLDIDVTSLTASHSAVNISTANTATTGNTAYGLYNTFASTAVVTGTAQNLYASYNSVTKTGLDTSVATTTLYGVYGAASNTGSTNVGTKNTYGGYFTATGDANGTTVAYGIYATATGADFNFAGCFDGSVRMGTSGTFISCNTNSNASVLFETTAVTFNNSGSGRINIDSNANETGNTLTIAADGAAATGGNIIASFAENGVIAFTPQVATSGTPSVFTVTSPANTEMTAATEVIGINFNLSATKTWATGAGPLAVQREVLIQAPTYAGGVAALTITKASTFCITNAPQVGANMAITTAYALEVTAGNNYFGGSVTIEPGTVGTLLVGSTVTSRTDTTPLFQEIALWNTTVATDNVSVSTLVLSRNSGDTGNCVGWEATVTTGDMADTGWSYCYGGTYSSAACTTATSNAAVFYAGASTTDAQCNDYGIYVSSGYDVGGYFGSDVQVSYATLLLNGGAVASTLDINIITTTYTTLVGAVDIVRSGALTGVATETLLDFNIKPTVTITEPGAGTFNYYGASIDMSSVAVTAGAGTSVLVALNLAANADADVGTTLALNTTGDIKLTNGRIYGGGIQVNYQTLAANTNLTLDKNDSVVSVTTGAVSDNTITLPAASGNEGMTISVYMVVDGNMNAVVTRAGADVIQNGSADLANVTVTLNDAGDFVQLLCVSSTMWQVVVNNGCTVA